MESKVSKKMLNKATKLYELITNELKRLEDYCNDVLSAVYGLKDNFIADENENKPEYNYFNNAVKLFEENLKEINRLKYVLIDKIHKYTRDLDNEAYEDKDLCESEVQELNKSTEFFIQILNNTLNGMNAIQHQVSKIKEEAKLHFKVEEFYEEEINSINHKIYDASNKVQMIISQIGERISQSIKKGNLHELIISDSLLKADLELLKNNKNKR